MGKSTSNRDEMDTFSRGNLISAYKRALGRRSVIFFPPLHLTRWQLQSEDSSGLCFAGI